MLMDFKELFFYSKKVGSGRLRTAPPPQSFRDWVLTQKHTELRATHREKRGIWAEQ